MKLCDADFFAKTLHNVKNKTIKTVNVHLVILQRTNSRSLDAFSSAALFCCFATQPLTQQRGRPEILFSFLIELHCCCCCFFVVVVVVVYGDHSSIPVHSIIYLSKNVRNKKLHICFIRKCLRFIYLIQFVIRL